MDTRTEIDAVDQSDFESWSTAEKIFSRFSYPIAVIAAISVYFYLTANEFQAPVALLICLYPVVFSVIFFERVFPNKKEWNQNQGDVLTDIAHNFLYYAVYSVSPVLTTVFVSTFFWVTDPILPSLQVAIWPNEWPLMAQFILALVVAEFIAYWVHRAHHTIPLLWRLHSIHHSPNRLYWLNSGRFHLLNSLIDLLTIFVVMDILGISLEVFMAFLLFTAVNGFFQHGNLKVSIGPLNWLVSGPELHRWHHSRNLKESSHNYGQNIILWDIIFGTRYLPKNMGQPKDIGIAYPSNFPKSFIRQQLSPFRWKKILKKET